MGIDWLQHRVLYVDDDPTAIRTFVRAAGPGFAVDGAGSGEEALAMLSERAYAVLVADQAMLPVSGIDLCFQARMAHPDVVRMIFTGYADLPHAQEAIARGHVFRYIDKPSRSDGIRGGSVRRGDPGLREARSEHRGRPAGRHPSA